MKKIFKNNAGKFSGFMLHFWLGIQTTVFLPIGLLIEKLLPRRARGQFWRTCAVTIIRNTFKLSDVKISAKHLDHILPNAIFAANHPSEMDGFLLLAVLGPDAILFTAPLGQFPLILKIWMKKMQTVDVRRDPIDDARYPESHTKKKAIDLAIKHLKVGRKLIIFPEGHVEIQHLLHYFHTGTARISLDSDTPIVPVSIVNADRVFPDGHHLFPGHVILNFGPAIAEKSSDAKKLRDLIERKIVQNLPLRSLPNYYGQKNGHVGVFVDIDRTIYEGFSQKDFIHYLLYLHKIQAKEAFRVFYWLFLEKLRQIRHEDLMKKALLILRGWDVAELHNYSHQIFQEKLIAKIQYGLFPILKDHAEQNHKLVLVSEVIHPLASEFKNLIRAGATLDTKITANHRCYTGETSCLCYKEQKARLVQEFAKRANIDLDKSFAYADSRSDVPFLELVKYPTAVNPDSDLLNYADAKNWDVIFDAS